MRKSLGKAGSSVTTGSLTLFMTPLLCGAGQGDLASGKRGSKNPTGGPRPGRDRL